MDIVPLFIGVFRLCPQVLTPLLLPFGFVVLEAFCLIDLVLFIFILLNNYGDLGSQSFLAEYFRIEQVCIFLRADGRILFQFARDPSFQLRIVLEKLHYLQFLQFEL